MRSLRLFFRLKRHPNGEGLEKNEQIFSAFEMRQNKHLIFKIKSFGWCTLNVFGVSVNFYM